LSGRRAWLRAISALAALALGVLLLAVGGAIGLVAWRRRVSAPLAVTRKNVKEDLEWAKERLP
jgi:hypothetical protein